MRTYTNTATIYLSASAGNDGFSGRTATPDGFGGGPYRTFSRVMEAVNSMRCAGIMTPVTVKVMEDTELPSPIVIGQKAYASWYDKAIPVTDVTFESFGEKRVRLIGGKRLTGFKKDTFRGHDCLSVFLPEVKSGAWRFTDLYVDGKAARRTRFPKTGTLKAVTTEFPSKNQNFFTGSKWFIAEKDDLAGLEHVEDATVSFCHYWIDEHTAVESYDRKTGKLTMANRSRFMITTDYEHDGASEMHYYLENVAESFGEKGEWTLVHETGMLYYVPEDGVLSEEGHEIFAPTLEKLVTVEGAPDAKVLGVRFRNLAFVCTKGDYTSTLRLTDEQTGEGFAADQQSVVCGYGALSFRNAEACTVENCTLNCLGLHGVEIATGCDGIRVENCTITELGGGGVKIFGGVPGGCREEREEAPTSHCAVRHNTICGCGRRHMASCGVLVCHSSHNEIAFNEIAYLAYSGVSVGWVWGYRDSKTYANRIVGNHIHHIGDGELSDMGGVYLLGKQHGTVVADNVIHDVVSRYYGGWGLYTDEGSSYITLENNVVWNCKCDAYHMHYGAYNTICGNVFAAGGDSVVRFSKYEQHDGAVLEHNVFVTESAPVYGDCGIYPRPCFTAHDNTVFAAGNEPTFYQSKGCGIAPMSLADWQNAYGLDEGTTVKPLPEGFLAEIGTLDWREAKEQLLRLKTAR